jgi:signal transduction histidine kinase
LSEAPFPRLVQLACHDLRTPLATVNGFAKTLAGSGQLGERNATFVRMIEQAAAQMTVLVDELGLAARIASGRYDPVPLEADTFDLAAGSGDERVAVEGAGAIVETDPPAASRALAALALAALRFGELDSVTWSVDGRKLTLLPVVPAAAEVLDGSSPRDLGALVATMAIEALGGSVVVSDGTLRVGL